VTRWAWVDVDLAAVAHNVTVLRRRVAPAAVWAVVKADGYGHGAVPVARAALGAGATGLCVALTQEARVLRDAGLDDPVLLLSEQPVDEIPEIVDLDVVPTVYSQRWIDALEQVVAERRAEPVGVHLKVDTGMQRVGAAPDAAVRLAERITASPHLRLDAVMTHLAVADEPDRVFTAEQIARLDEVLARLPEVPTVHAANSAGGLAHPTARRSMVRAGISIYGISPGHGVDDLCAELRPALALRARVSFVKQVAAGSGVSYGLRHTFERATTVATLPLGYADGVRRSLAAAGGEVLIGGRRCRIVGVITMDQLMVDVGDLDVAVGDEAVLIGRQGDEEISATEWADRLGTIAYEITCGISPRLPRRWAT
jgi:alanine racemase